MSRSSQITESARAKRFQVVEVAAELFDQRSYDAVSMDEVAEGAGLAKPTLYHYFSGKAAILYEIHAQFFYPLLEAARERARNGGSASEELKHIVRDVLTVSAEKKGYLRVFSEHIRSLEPDKREVVIGQREEYRHMVESAIRRGVSDGEFDVKDPKIASMTLIGAVVWSYQWLHNYPHSTIDELAEVMWDLLVGGLRGPSPRSAGAPDLH